MSKHVLNEDPSVQIGSSLKKKTKYSIMATISDVSNTLFNPLLRTKDEVKKFLLARAEDGAAHSFDGSLLLLKKLGDGTSIIHEIDISDKDETFFSQAVDLNSLTETINNRIQKFPMLSDYKDYTVVSLTQSYIEVDLRDVVPTIIALSVRKPTYYDFCAGHADNQIVCYNATTNSFLPGMFHSGDINNGEELLHTLTFDDKLDNKPFALFVSGYTRKELMLYQPQNPAVMIVDHAAKLMYVIPVPLDQATIGNATICVPIVGRRRGDKIGFGMLPSASTEENLNASAAKLASQNGCLAQAISREIQPVLPPAHNVEDIQVPESVDAMEEDEEELEDGEKVEAEKLLFVVEQGCSLPSFIIQQQGTLVSFRQSITAGLQPRALLPGSDPVVLPVALGNTLEGTRLLALGKPFEGPRMSLIDYHDLYNNAEAVIVVVSDKMTDQARLLNPTLRCNALFVVQSSSAKPVNNRNPEAIRELLNGTNINAVTALAGPQSIVVVKLGERYFFFRGIRWAGFMDILPEYGEDVTDLLNTYADWAAKKVALPWKRITEVNENSDIYFSGNAVPCPQLSGTFNALTFPQLEKFKLDIFDTLAQLQSILLPKDMQKFTFDLQVALKTKMEQIVAPLKEEYMVEIKARKTFADRGKSPLYAKLRKAEKDTKVQCQWLIDELGKMVSSKTSSTKGHDLKMMIRKAQIADNVGKATSMTYDEFGEILEDKCADLGVIIGNLDTENYTDVLRAAGKGSLMEDLQKTDLQTKEVCMLDGRIMNLNGLDASVIFPMAQKYHNGPLAGSVGTLVVGVPRGLSTDGDIGSAMAWPCFDEFNDIDDPFNLMWTELTNASHISAIRILQRNTIANATHSRSFQISPASKDLGVLLAHTLTDLMMRLAQLRSQPPSAEDVGDTSTRIMRGLWGYLMTLLASGAQPITMAWQMSTRTQSIEVPEETNWWLYSRLVQIFPYTGWPQRQMKRNAATIIAKVIRKQITSKVTDPMIKGVSAMEENTNKERLANKNVQLAWTHLAVDTLKEIILKPDTINMQQVSKRLLESIPQEHLSLTKGGYSRIIRTFLHLASGKETGNILNEHLRLHAANLQIKRAAFMKQPKNAFLEACSKPNNAKERKAAYQALIQSHKEFADSWQLQNFPLHLQNEKNLQKLLDHIEDEIIDKKLIASLKGDAETIRQAWLVGKPFAKDELKPADYSHMLPYVLTGVHGEAKTSEVLSEVKAPVKQLSLEQRLIKLPNGKAAAVLQVQVQNKITTLKSFCQIGEKISRDDFEILMGSVGMTLKDLKKAVDIFLEKWQDSVGAEKVIVNMFMKNVPHEKKKEVEDGEAASEDKDAEMTG